MKLKLKKNKNYRNINYNFHFVSLISPFLIKNLQLTSSFLNLNNKILVKQSYILLTWFYYLSFTKAIDKLKQDTNAALKISILPTKKKIFTTTKAPMAHKNWSKEQYKFQFYNFKIMFTSNLVEKNSLNSLNSGLLFVLLGKKYFPFIETNVFFLKSSQFTCWVNDNNYFNYYKFVHKHI